MIVGFRFGSCGFDGEPTGSLPAKGIAPRESGKPQRHPRQCVVLASAERSRSRVTTETPASQPEDSASRGPESGQKLPGREC